MQLAIFRNIMYLNDSRCDTEILIVTLPLRRPPHQPS